MSTWRALDILRAAMVFVALPLTWAACSQPQRQRVSTEEIASSFGRAMAFLEGTQDNYGEFPSTACDRAGLCHVDSTPFFDTFVLSSLSGIKGPRVDRMRSRAISFLQDEMLPGGIWRFWTFRAPDVPILQPDLDDTVTASDILLRAGKMSVDNRGIILRNMDIRNRFLTWLLPTERSLTFDFDPASRLRNQEPRPDFEHRRDHEFRKYRWMVRNEFPNETDSAVNANVLLYLQEEIPSVCDYLNAVIVNAEPSVYYLGMSAQYYMYGRAYSHGIRCLAPSKNLIVERLLKMQDSKGSFGSPQQTALVLNTLQDFRYEGAALESATRSLLSTQKPDGSWADEFFFKESAFCKECHYWRSAAFTTALAVEAFSKRGGLDFASREWQY